MEQATCGSCLYFRQHYAFDQRKLFRVYYGHCTYQRAKGKRPDAKICENYTPGIPDENAFVTKEYLSKKLLEYMLQLDLLPQIFGDETNSQKTDSAKTPQYGKLP